MSDELPEGWITARLADVVQQVPNVKPEDESKREFGYVDISSICNSTHRVMDAKRFKGSEAPSRARRPIRVGDVLFSNVRTYLRNIAIVPEGLDVHLCSTGFTALRSNGAVDPHFLFRYVLTDDFIDRVTPQQTGTHYPATSDRVVMSEWLPLPPLAEQQRIVAKVEELLAQVSAARERLARVPAILKRFRQAVLAAACSGRLTQDWREAEQDVEPAAVLIASILRDRSKRYEETVKARSNGTKASRKPRNLVRQEVAAESLPELPESWEWATWDDLADRVTYGFTRPMPHVSDGIPIVSAKNVRDGYLDWAEVERTTPEAFAGLSEKDKPRRGEILITKDGAIRGRATLVEIDEPFCITQAVAVVRFGGLTAYPPYLLRVIHSPFTQRLIDEESSGTAIPHISITDFGRFAVPLPPLREQEEIVRRVEALFALADAIEKRVAAATLRVEKLTQAVLAKAFRGELVPTEAELARREGRDYEPAAALLERIRAERAPENGRPSRKARLTAGKRKRGDTGPTLFRDGK